MPRLLRFLLYTLLGLYICVVLGVSALRFWVLPSINDWREPLQQKMSSALGSQLSFERIEASWRGLHPSIEFSGVELRPEEMPDASLHIPLLRLKLSWSSLTARTFHFKHIEIEGLSLPVRRDEQARLHLGEIELSPAAAFADNQPVLNESEFVHWLVQQPKVSIRDATLIWEDQLRAKKPVALDKIQLSLTSTPRRYHVELHSQDDRAEQAGLLLIADFERSVSSPLNLDQAQGRVYVRAAGNGTALWNSWLPVPDDWSFYLEQAALWLDIEQGRIEALRFDTLATDVALSAGEQVITARRLDASIQGPWSSIDHWVRGEDLADTELSLDAYVEGLRLGAEPIWQHGLEVARAALSASWAGGVLQLSKAAIETADFSLTTRGTWTESADSDLGELSLHGELNALHLAHLYRYFPVLIDEDVTDWLEHSLVKGQLEQGAFVLSGDLSAFPFNAEPEKGYFYVGGNIRNASVDYLPAEAGEVSWPPVSGANGYLYLERAGLYADFDQGQIEIDPARPVQASRIKVSIPDMESEATLVIQAQTAALASDYLALMTRSPLGGLLNHSLDEAKAQGRWQVPLQLTVPLHNPNAISLQGHIAMSESTLQLFPDFPLITKLSGQLEFDETGVGSDDLKGEWLGQAITLRDKLAIGEKGLSIEGTLDVAQLKSYVQQELLERFSGTAAFLVNMRIADEGQLLIDSFSTLEGLALSLPEPFIKTAAQQWPLKLAWMPAANGNDYRLMMKLGETLQAEFIQDRASAASGFHTGAITTKDELRLPEEGLRVDLRYPRLDLDDWYALISSLRSRQDRDQGSGWPSLTSLRLQSEQSLMLGLPFSQLTVTAQRPAYKRWRVDLSSTEVAGSIQWAVDANGDIDGLLDAHLQRLVLWEPALESEIKKHEPAEDAEDLFDGDLQLPELAIRIDHLRVAGLSLGEFNAIGDSVAHQDSWVLNTLHLDAPGIRLEGRGTWRLTGPDRGLGVDVNISVNDLGEYLRFAGKPELMHSGNGDITAKLNWRRLPWSIDVANLEGEIQVDLSRGRFNSINSRSARLLELLSLQSLGRMASLDLNLGALTRDGFPYDQLLGTLTLHDARLSTYDYRVIGPVGAIVIEGDVGLKAENVNLDAVVVPRLDVSGAAIAAGIAVNPLLGAGAFLAQWIMQSPMSKAMTVRYSVNGQWDNLNISESSEPIKTQEQPPAIEP